MKRCGAFTFVEVLTAMVFLGVLMPVVISALLQANHAGSAAERTTIAVQLAENQLNELTLSGAWSTSATRGDFGAEWPGYRWELTKGDWENGAMTQLTVDVFFQTQGKERNVRLSTLVSESLTQLQQQQTPTQ